MYTTDEKNNIDQKGNQRLPSYFLTITKINENKILQITKSFVNLQSQLREPGCGAVG